MRVLVFSQGFGGRTLTFIYNEVVAMSKHCDVHVICNDRGNSEPVRYGPVTEVPWKPNKLLAAFNWQLWKYDLLFSEYNPAFKKAIDDVIDRVKPDVIHCHFGNESVRFMDNFHRTDIPVVISFHGYDATQFDDKKCYRRKLKSIFDRPNVFPVFCSKYLRGRVDQMGVNVRKGFLLYYGVNLDQFRRTQTASREDGIRFIQVSSFAPQKGHVVTVEAIRKFRDRHPEANVKFIFGGTGSTELDRTQSLVKKYRLENAIQFTGELDAEGVRHWLEKSHIFIHHSVTGPDGETEGLPNAIIEAMAMEMPVLSSWHAGIPELVIDSKNGYLVKEHDVNTYVDKIEAIMNWDYQPGNRSRVLEMCDLKSHTAQLLEIYNKVTGKN
jgi:colanic acid/amylovoran biosynthesis glycosyltransferase